MNILICDNTNISADFILEGSNKTMVDVCCNTLLQDEFEVTHDMKWTQIKDGVMLGKPIIIVKEIKHTV